MASQRFSTVSLAPHPSYFVPLVVFIQCNGNVGRTCSRIGPHLCVVNDSMSRFLYFVFSLSFLIKGYESIDHV